MMSAINHFIKKGVRQAEIDEYLSSELARAGYGGVDIAKTPLGERITIHASRPGIVIGRRGKNIRAITDELVTRFGFENPQIEVKEVVNPEQNPKVMAYSLVSAIERGVHRRRAAYSVLRRVVNSGAKGCEILISGKLTSKRSRHEAYRMGLLAKSGEVGTRYVQRANATAVMKLGAIGITVNIMRGDVVLPDDINVLIVNLDEPEVITEEITEDGVKITEKPVTTKPAPKEKADKAPKKAAAAKPEAGKAPVSKKKTDLDLKVEELSDLIEKTPGEEKKPVKKTTKTTKKPVTATKKTPTKAAPKVGKAKPKTTTKKETPTKKVPTTKKTPTTKKSVATKKVPAKKATTTAKKTAKPKTEKKPEAKAKTSTAKKETKAKSTKKKDDKKNEKKKK